MGIVVVSYPERPELWEETAAISEEVWPEYNLHGDVLNAYWSRLPEQFPDYQFALYDDETGEVVAEGHTAPCCWDGTHDGLGDGIDELILAVFDPDPSRTPATALCALAAEVRPQFQGRGLAARVLDAMADLAREKGLGHLIAPVRPSLKDRYPLIAIDEYVRWTREDGEPFDPWIRVHTRRGGELARPVPHSLRITGSVADWEEWTGMRFPGDGRYTFPAGLAPLEVDHGRDLGSYWEPNVWITHAVEPG
jgi:GNAT superfamily N-acetyltransferase